MNAITGMNLDRAAKLAARLGATVKALRRTGELGSASPAIGKRCRVNSRRHDCPASSRCGSNDSSASSAELAAGHLCSTYHTFRQTTEGRM
jgi:hypothetical protein